MITQSQGRGLYRGSSPVLNDDNNKIIVYNVYWVSTIYLAISHIPSSWLTGYVTLDRWLTLHKLSLCRAEVAQSCPTLCDPMDCSPPGSSVHGVFRAWILEWVAISFFRVLICKLGIITVPFSLGCCERHIWVHAGKAPSTVTSMCCSSKAPPCRPR